MQQIIPFQHTDEALAALDNGGRFYNWFTKAHDGIITTPELGKVAGVYTGKQQMSIYLAMALARLSPVGQEQVIYSLSPDLKNAFKQHLPAFLSPGQVAAEAPVSSGIISMGTAKPVRSASNFKGFIIVPIMTGNAMTVSMIPIMDRYEVYEFTDRHSPARFLIAHPRGKEKLPETPLRIGGIIKELKADKRERTPAERFLEVLYYSEV